MAAPWRRYSTGTSSDGGVMKLVSSTGPTDGSDKLGSYSSVSSTWTAGGAQMMTSIRTYSTREIVVSATRPGHCM